MMQEGPLHGARIFRREVSIGQKIAGRFLVVMSGLFWVFGGLGALAGTSGLFHSVLEDMDAEQALVGSGLLLVGLLVMFVGSVAMQGGAWMAGKDVWHSSRQPIKVACLKALAELVSVVGLLSFVGGVVWLGSLLIYRDFSTAPVALVLMGVGAIALGVVVWWSRIAGGGRGVG